MSARNAHLPLGILALELVMIGVILLPTSHRPPELPPASPAAIVEARSRYVAALDVARVFGRAPGCTEATPDLITEVADAAVKENLDPRILAATVAIESACDPLALSGKAVGLTGVVPKIWKGSYNFEHDYNLLNPADNLKVGAAILAPLVKQYGVPNGLRRYNGTATASPDYDATYVDRITTLAAARR